MLLVGIGSQKIQMVIILNNIGKEKEHGVFFFFANKKSSLSRDIQRT